MNRLPAHRQAINGRTWPQTWSASSMDPMSHYRRSRRVLTLAAGYALAAVIAVGLALVIVHWIDWSLA